MTDDTKGNVVNFAAWREASETEKKFLFAVGDLVNYFVDAMSRVEHVSYDHDEVLAGLPGE